MFPLVWMGGLVTTYGAGMAVPDWPTTYGYWWYPLKLWAVVWDLLLEHSHRVLAQSVGLLSVALVLAIWIQDRRKSVRWLAVLLLAGVIFQGVLGGLRVLQNDLTLAKVHGCTAPLVFTLATLLVTMTSRRWRMDGDPGPPRRTTPRIGVGGLASAAAAVVYVQVVLGVQLRQLTPDDAPGWFTLWVWLHVTTALLVAALAAWLVVGARQTPAGRRTLWLALLITVQLALGAATWVTNYGWPKWFTDYLWTLEYTVVAEGRLQVLMTGLHTAVGSLVLASAAVAALWARRGDATR